MKKRGEGEDVFIEPLGEVAIFLRSVKNLWDVHSIRPLAGIQDPEENCKKFVQGLPKTPQMY
jgi:hypothetical protein